MTGFSFAVNIELQALIINLTSENIGPECYCLKMASEGQEVCF